MNNKVQLLLTSEMVELLDDLLERAKKIDSLNIKNRNDLINEIFNWGVHMVGSEISRHEAMLGADVSGR